MSELILLAHVPTDSVNEGFLPAARALGLSVVLLSDQAEAHRQHFGGRELAAYPDAVVPCDVFNPIAVIEAITRRGKKPAAIFSNSDHLRTSTALPPIISVCGQRLAGCLSGQEQGGDAECPESERHRSALACRGVG